MFSLSLSLFPYFVFVDDADERVFYRIHGQGR